MNAQAAFEILRETVKPEMEIYFQDCEFSYDLDKYLYDSLHTCSKSLRKNYTLNKELTEQNWNELEQLIQIFFSPLYKALT